MVQQDKKTEYDIKTKLAKIATASKRKKRGEGRESPQPRIEMNSRMVMFRIPF